MAAFRTRPFLENKARNDIALERRRMASTYASGYAAVPTEFNADESELQGEGFAASFTKGLPHDDFAQLISDDDYIALVNQINQQDAEPFDAVARGIDADSRPLTRRAGGSSDGSDIHWRGWESPRAGHYFDLQGPDADAVGMPPAPELGSEELSAEMAEVYALALLRDVPFSQISDLSGADSKTGLAVSDVLAAKAGPYVSQFMLLGNRQEPASGNVKTASIANGRQIIDQKIETFTPHRDFMLHWNACVDVQNGADFGADNTAGIRAERRFITTPRDLATYVRYDALYQAYLNACLFMLGDGANFGVQKPVKHPYTGKPGPGFPDGPGDGLGGEPPSRQAFATFGGPHILSLVTEVATRCLKAVRRQKFNYHRRARPERIGALLTLKATEGAGGHNDVSGALGGKTSSLLSTMLGDAQLGPLLALVNEHNDKRLAQGDADPHLDFTACQDAGWFEQASNFLLPMAFAEGSPMHPSYGAGHATVAGGCVTVLKAFFDTTDRHGQSHAWPADLRSMQATIDGDELEDLADREGMTISGELNKLAANISIARNMAGVHYYTDYYESLRMGERVATGMLIEQMKQYNEPVEFSFESFDGDHVHLLKNDYDYSDPRVFVHDANGEDVGLDTWWHRHLDTDDTTAPVQLASGGGRASESTQQQVDEQAA